MNYFEIDYDEQSDLLFKLTRQTIEKFRINLADNKLMNVVQLSDLSDLSADSCSLI